MNVSTNQASVSPRSSRGCLLCSPKKSPDPKPAVSPSATQATSTSTPIVSSERLSRAFTFTRKDVNLVKDATKEKVGKIIEALTAEDVAHAYDPSRQFSLAHVSSPAQNKLKLLWADLIRKQAAPFLFVKGTDVLFSTQTGFACMKIDDLGKDLSLVEDLNQGLTFQLKSKLDDELNVVHTIDISNSSSQELLSIKVYPYQNSVSQISTLTFAFKAESVDSSTFISNLRGKFPDSGDKALSIKTLNDVIICTISFQKSTGSYDKLLKEVLSKVLDVSNTHTDFHLDRDSIKMFDSSFCEILTPMKYASKAELLSQLEATSFTCSSNASLKLLSMKIDGSYPSVVFLEKPSQKLIQELGKKAEVFTSTPEATRERVADTHPSYLVFFGTEANMSQYLEAISQDALTQNYKYSYSVAL